MKMKTKGNISMGVIIIAFLIIAGAAVLLSQREGGLVGIVGGLGAQEQQGIGFTFYGADGKPISSNTGLEIVSIEGKETKGVYSMSAVISVKNSESSSTSVSACLDQFQLPEGFIINNVSQCKDIAVGQVATWSTNTVNITGRGNMQFKVRAKGTYSGGQVIGLMERTIGIKPEEQPTTTIKQCNTDTDCRSETSTWACVNYKCILIDSSTSTTTTSPTTSVSTTSTSTTTTTTINTCTKSATGAVYNGVSYPNSCLNDYTVSLYDCATNCPGVTNPAYLAENCQILSNPRGTCESGTKCSNGECKAEANISVDIATTTISELKHFGATCSSNAECVSNLCLPYIPLDANGYYTNNPPNGCFNGVWVDTYICAGSTCLSECKLTTTGNDISTKILKNYCDRGRVVLSARTSIEKSGNYNLCYLHQFCQTADFLSFVSQTSYFGQFINGEFVV